MVFVPGMENTLLNKSTELDACKARVHALEESVTKKDLAIAEQKRMIKSIKVIFFTRVTLFHF